MEFRGFVEKEICTDVQAFFAILRVRVIRTNYDLEIGMVWTNRTENIKSCASGHFQVENHRVRAQLLDATYRLRHIACLSDELDTRYVPQEVGQTLDDYSGIICDKDSHLLLSP